jgi:hypothetical protein
LPQGATTEEEEAEGIRMTDFFNKLAGRASGEVKRPQRGGGPAGVFGYVLVSDVRRVALLKKMICDQVGIFFVGITRLTDLIGE